MLSQAKILFSRDFDVQRRAFDDADRLTAALDQLRVVGRRKSVTRGIGVQQDFTAEDLRRLRFP